MTQAEQQPDENSSATQAEIERLQRDLGANLPGIIVILDLLNRLTTLQREVEQWRRRS
jgi:hypothetical protein